MNTFRQISELVKAYNTNFNVRVKVCDVKVFTSRTNRNHQSIIAEDQVGVQKVLLNCKFPTITLDKGHYVLQISGFSQSPYKETLFVNKATVIDPFTPSITPELSKTRKENVSLLNLRVEKVFSPEQSEETEDSLLDYDSDLVVKLKDDYSPLTYFMRLWSNQSYDWKQNFIPGARVYFHNVDMSKKQDQLNVNLSMNHFTNIVFES